METETKPENRTDERQWFVDEEMVRRIVAEQNELMGFVPDPDATPEKAQAMVAADLKGRGLKPEDNFASSEIIRMRYPDEK